MDMSSYNEKYKLELEYIDKFWEKVTVRRKKREDIFNILFRRAKAKKRMHKNILNMPYSFIVPNTNKFTHVFYWDTFFMFRGLIRTRHEWLLRSMVNNFIYLYDKYGIIPNFNSPASVGRSQPPLFTSMILDAYNGFYFARLGENPFKKAVRSLKQHKKWLAKATEVAKREYWNVWVDENNYFHHKIDGHILNRYGDRDIGYAHSSELESGWDFTSRFYNRCDEFMPVDLNVFLFKYERDFAKIAEHLKKPNDQEYWSEMAKNRRAEINKYMWNEDKGFFFDYGYVHERPSEFLSLAGFTPLWAGLATREQAAKMVKKLPLFETKAGLVICTEDSLAPKINLDKTLDRYRIAMEDVIRPKQWDYPNIWPPLEYLTVIGLLKYGYVKDAVRIMKKSLSAQNKIFKKYGTFFEKIDGVNIDKTGNFHYENQAGFGWTNAVFYRYVQILDAIEEGINIYTEPKAKNPPYKLLIPH